MFFNKIKINYKLLVLFLLACSFSCNSPKYDIVIRNGQVYDGTGSDPQNIDIAIQGDTIAFIGKVKETGRVEVDAKGMAVAPGFINTLSWANRSLITDGRSVSDILQGVTLEVFGEGRSGGPLNDAMKKELKERAEYFNYNNEWTSFGEFLEFLTKKGVSCNVASFVGATTLRRYALGYENRDATDEEIQLMKGLVAEAMKEGALGVGSSLIYAPAYYASTNELIELSKTAAEYGGMYISHMRSEADEIETALEELITIAREAKIRAEIYHIKLSGRKNWSKVDKIIGMIKEARASGLEITSNMYNYIASSTGLDANVPTWAQDGTFTEWIGRLQNEPERRAKALKEMKATLEDYRTQDKIMIVGVKNDSLRPYVGKYLSEISASLELTPEETILELLYKNQSDIQAVYFLMSEDVVKQFMQMPFTSFCSDARSIPAELPFTKNSTHPRTYGNFARLLGKYVREEGVLTLQEAIYRMTGLSAEKLRIKKRGLLRGGYFADVVIFDPNTIQDRATFKKPHQYSVGVSHVWVNGVQVVQDGKHTGAKPGRVVRGSGWVGWKEKN